MTQKEKRAEYNAMYRASARGIETRRKYRESAKCKASASAYKATAEYKAARAAYRARPESKAAAAAYNARPERKAIMAAYTASPKAIAARIARNSSPKGKARLAGYYAKRKDSMARYRAMPEVKIKRAIYARKRRYGLDEAAYLSMWDSQGRKCANDRCRTDLVPNTAACHIDHCHKTKAVRGMLCRRCNHILGVIEANQERIVGLNNYLLTRTGGK